jgi:hypothetical protein
VELFKRLNSPVQRAQWLTMQPLTVRVTWTGALSTKTLLLSTLVVFPVDDVNVVAKTHPTQV